VPGAVNRPENFQPVADDVTLHLCSGLIDQRHIRLKPSHAKHARFLDFTRWQDTWSHQEHASRWSWALAEWPTSTKPRHHDALAFVIAYAVDVRPQRVVPARPINTV
jgi:hypothetical protein